MNPVSWFQTARYIRDLAPRAIIFQWWHPFFGPAYRYIAKHTQQENCTQIFLCHNVEPHESSFFDKRLLQYAYAPIHHFVVQSSLEKTRLQQYKPQAEIRVHVHPVYSFFANPAPDQQLVKLPASEITLLYFGLVRRYKGLDILLEAMPLIRESVDAHLMVVGEFYDEKEPYLQQIRTLGITDSVTIVDEYVPDEQVGWYFQQADVVVLPYRHATQSGIIPIAYNFTVPVIATHVGGLPDVVFEGETGYLVPPEDSTALADTVAKFARQRNQIDFQSHITEHLDMFSWKSLRTTLLEMITTSTH